MNKTVYLIDASSIFFRAYYAIPPMQVVRGSKKQPLATHAVYGFLTTTLKLLKDNPEYIVYCFDRAEPLLRLKIYKEYKANREEMPEDLAEQIPYIHQAVDFLGLPRMDRKGCEADDIIGSLAHFSQKHKAQTVIVSSDKDFAQLIGDSVSMHDPIKDIHYTVEKAVAKWQVHPRQMIDYLALTGDASDNIPGVRGIGPKSAQKLLSEHQTLDNIYKNLQKIPPKMSEKLKASQDLAFISQKLATIVTDLPLISDLKEIKRKPVQAENLKKLLAQLEFASIQKKLFPPKKSSPSVEAAASTQRGTPAAAPSDPSYLSSKLLRMKKQVWSLSQLSENLKPYEEVAVFLFQDRVHLLFKKNYVEILLQDFCLLGEILSYKKIRWVGFDLKSIWKQCRPENPIASWDMMAAVHLIGSQPVSDFQETLKKEWGEDFSFKEDQSLLYLMESRPSLQKQLEEMSLTRVYEDIELPLISVLYRMETRGVLVDKNKLLTEKRNLECDLLELENKIFSYAGHPFNIASPGQLAYVLFEEMGLKKGRKIKTGYSTSSSVLHDLKKDHPIARVLLDYRELFKLKTTYAEGLLGAIDAQTGRIHTCFRQTFTSTGRLSSIKPNLQNIPIRTERGRRIRSAFIAEKGQTLICADYSQIELRILAHVSEDPVLQKAFLNGEDIHKAAAAEVFNTPLRQVSENQRRAAKTVNFGIIYGQGPFSLAESLNISYDSACDLVEKYFTRFKKVKDYIKSCIDTAKKKTYAETLFGRRRYIPELYSKNKQMQKFGERAAVNSCMQGSAGELVKMAMIQLDESVWSRILLQIHDELLLECPAGREDLEIQEIQHIMENVSLLKVPLLVHIGRASNWQSAGNK